MSYVKWVFRGKKQHMNMKTGSDLFDVVPDVCLAMFYLLFFDIPGNTKKHGSRIGNRKSFILTKCDPDSPARSQTVYVCVRVIFIVFAAVRRFKVWTV